MSSIEIGISFYVLPVIFNLLPKSLCYNFNGRFFDLYEVSEGYFNSPGVVPRCFGIWRALGAYPWLSFDHKNNQHPWLSFHHQSNRLQRCDNIIWSPKQSMLWKWKPVEEIVEVHSGIVGYAELRPFIRLRVRVRQSSYHVDDEVSVDDEVCGDDWYEGSWLKNITLSRRLFNV